MFFLLATSQFPANDLVLPPPALRDLERSAEQGKKQKTEAPRTFLASRRGRVTGCVSAASLDGCTGWSLRGGWTSAAHTPLPASPFAPGVWVRVINVQFSLVCFCRFFRVRQKICWRAVSHVHFPKVFHGAFPKRKQSTSPPICILLLPSWCKNINSRYRPVGGGYIFSLSSHIK